MRKIIASLFLLALMVGWIVLATAISTQIVDAPRLVQLAFYVVAGVGWILPLKPVFAWMNRGVVDDNE
jgi:Protein of unknown function (DUF2842)